MYVFAVKHEKLSGCLEIESSMMKLGSADRGGCQAVFRPLCSESPSLSTTSQTSIDRADDRTLSFH